MAQQKYFQICIFTTCPKKGEVTILPGIYFNTIHNFCLYRTIRQQDFQVRLNIPGQRLWGCGGFYIVATDTPKEKYKIEKYWLHDWLALLLKR
ncbi:MAG: hypothetical protein NTW29_02360 [Bacteroidetes bacterium]|nr:hypothetical protein [Bacteroidota bacterium]